MPYTSIELMLSWERVCRRDWKTAEGETPRAPQRPQDAETTRRRDHKTKSISMPLYRHLKKHNFKLLRATILKKPTTEEVLSKYENLLLFFFVIVFFQN